MNRLFCFIIISIVFILIIVGIGSITLTTTSCATLDQLAQYEDELIAVIDILIKQEEDRQAVDADTGNTEVMFNSYPRHSKLEELRTLKAKIERERKRKSF